MSRPRCVDLFAGPGGWDEGLAELGVRDVVGLEWSPDPCRTAVAAGHARIQTDVATYPAAVFAGAEGVIASPPCPSWSRAGNRAAFLDIPKLEAHLDLCRDGWVDYDRDGWADRRTPLVLEPLRWVDAVRPRWVACEQVRDVLPFWRRMAGVLRGWGYEADARILLAADYGVPQTRERAFLIASRDGVRWPEVTHFGDRRRKGQPDLFGQPWVTVAEALGWDETAVVATNRDQRDDGTRQESPAAAAAPTVTGKSSGQWKLRLNNQANAAVRDPLTEPSSTVFCGKALNSMKWVHERPAPTIIGTPRIARPGHRNWGDDDGPKERHFDAESIDVEIWQLGVLQSFRPDYPWQGSRTSQGLQVGNAVPPLLAAAVLAPLLGLSREEAA